MWASGEGHDCVVEMLLQAEAELNVQSVNVSQSIIFVINAFVIYCFLLRFFFSYNMLVIIIVNCNVSLRLI